MWPALLHCMQDVSYVGFRGLGRLDISRPILDCDNGCFLGLSGGDRGPVHFLHRLGLTPPTPFLPNAVKDSPGRGRGRISAGNFTVTQCRALVFVFPPFRRGKCCPFFFLCFSCLARCLLSFFVVLRVAFWKNFRERTFVFGWCSWSCVFRWFFAYVFALFFGSSLPKVFGKILLMSGLVFWGSFSLLLVFSSKSFFVFFKRDSSGSNRTPPHTRLFCCSFSLFVSRRFCLFRPFWPCVPLLGVPFWAPCVFGILLVLVLRPFFLGREAARVFRCFSCLVFLFPLVFCFAATLFLDGPGVVSLTRRVVLPTPRRSDSQGTAQFWAGAIGRPLFGDFDGIFCLPEGHRDPRTHSVQGPFCWGGGL